MKRLCLASAALSFGCAGLVSADHHLMQIQQFMAGVGSDKTAQAIQLRMRGFGQQFITQTRLRAYDAAGENPITIVDIDANVANSAVGSTVLICTESFKAKTLPAAVPDFVMTNPIPLSYLAAGRLVFEHDNGNKYWSLAWGGPAYTGPHAITFDNDADANSAPAFASPVPSYSNRSLLFKFTQNALSTNNANDYAISTASAVFRNNANINFTVQNTCRPDINGDGFVDDADFAIFSAAYNALICPLQCPADFTGNFRVDDEDFVVFVGFYDRHLCP